MHQPAKKLTPERQSGIFEKETAPRPAPIRPLDPWLFFWKLRQLVEEVILTQLLIAEIEPKVTQARARDEGEIIVLRFDSGRYVRPFADHRLHLFDPDWFGENYAKAVYLHLVETYGSDKLSFRYWLDPKIAETGFHVVLTL
jgi:hypothetical protein